MAIDLTEPLDDLSLTAATKALLKELQGNILKGHGREHTANVFLTFPKARSAQIKSWIAKFADSVTQAGAQLAETAKRKAHFEVQKELVRSGKQKVAKEFVSAPIRLLFLSASGYAALGVPTAKIPKGSPAWIEGMKKRQALLTDPVEADWDPDLQGQIHAMVLLADTDTDKVKALVDALEKELSKVGAVIKHTETGLAWKNENGDGIEHFGYVDGRSQPLLLTSDVKKEKEETDGISVWDPKFPLSQVLVPDPAGTPEKSFGSYFVFRKLEQNVKKFKELEDDLAEVLGLEGEDEERAGALIVGRFEDGTPVVLQESAGMHSPVPNNFDYRDDPIATKCPFHSHIRKTNPRGESPAFLKEHFGIETTVADERSHLMARRGITYGSRRVFKVGEGVEFKDQPEGGVGLLFMAYQSNIENQFEFTQTTWANNPDFVKPDTGIDPVIGQGGPGGQECPMHWGRQRKDNEFKKFDFRDSVTFMGGEYFFAPSISGMKNL